jgi:tRNA wybutosine-synthesizing protein 1
MLATDGTSTHVLVWVAVALVIVGVLGYSQAAVAMIRRWFGLPATPSSSSARRMTIVYATQRGTARGYAHRIFTAVTHWRNASPLHRAYMDAPLVVDAAAFEAEALAEQDMVVLVLATYTDGKAPESCERFRMDLFDMSADFRYGAGHLRRQTSFVFGLGDVEYANNFNGFAKDASDWLRSLGAVQATPPRLASTRRAQPVLVGFIGDILSHLDEQFAACAPQRSAAASVCKAPRDRGADATAALESESDADESAVGSSGAPARAVDDLEDMGGLEERDELLYPRLRQSLSKQGYKLIGSHSAVKLCRWTKAMLRGRGGCYKHTFYNISSYQCMEMTPNLACANKCVFCWRHHTNPVGRDFTWKVDSPEFLVESALAEHRAMLRPLKGVPGVTTDRLADAMNVRHCALSLVGEPIMYPRINDFVSLLHHKHISTFLVSNAQFPDRVRDLGIVTQLYLSIDAATPAELKAIDRPLFEDFWERMLACLHELRQKPYRTVFRLTLVDGYNMTNLHEYGRLIEIARPDFIEVKGVTYCGDSDSSTITMQNVPFHTQVVSFCQDLVTHLNITSAAATTTSRGSIAPSPLASNQPHHRARSMQYDLAAEHEHSCCVLIANERFRKDGVWHTWIDYAKFFALLESGGPFTSADYCAPTPAWAVFRSAERGFDPDHTRHYRKNRTLPTAGC